MKNEFSRNISGTFVLMQSVPQKKRKSYLFEEILRVLGKHPSNPLNYKQIAAHLKIRDTYQRQLVRDLLEDMAFQGKIEQARRGKFKMKQLTRVITGIVDMTMSGSAYILSDGLEQDVFVPLKKMNNAMDGDTVRVRLLERRRKPEGEVIEIVKRSREEFVGTIELSRKFAFLIPDGKAGTDIYIPLEYLNEAKNGQKALVKIVQWPKRGGNPVGEVIEVLGYPGEHDTEMHSIMAEFNLPSEFPKHIEQAAQSIPLAISPEEISKRRDFRKITTFTIDPVDAKDFDDALSIRKSENGNWEIGIHIADVAHYVKQHSALDQEALRRGTSVYLVDRVIPMLPEILSNHVCSLRPNEDKLCFSAVFEMNEDAKIIHQWFGRTIIRSGRRFTYEEAQEILDAGRGDFAEELKTLDRLAKKLREDRFRKGSIAFEKLEMKFHLDEAGNPTGVYMKEMKDSNKLIEDFMLLANRKVAEFCAKPHAFSPSGSEGDGERLKSREMRSRPFVFRVHDEPDPEKLKNFAQVVKAFGYSMNLKSTRSVAESMNKLLRDVQGKPECSMLEMLAIRTMAKAHYTIKNIGHYGLGFEHYTHFTSPIRRYPDVMVHRLLEKHLHEAGGAGKVNEKDLEEQCRQSSHMERNAEEAERESVKYMQVKYMADKVGGEFEGMISGVSEWGIYVEIAENHCEGMVRLKDMKDDFYRYDEKNHCVTGSRYKRKYTLGDRVKIEVKRADLIKKQLDFALAEETEKHAEAHPKKKIYKSRK